MIVKSLKLWFSFSFFLINFNLLLLHIFISEGQVSWITPPMIATSQSSSLQPWPLPAFSPPNLNSPALPPSSFRSPVIDTSLQDMSTEVLDVIAKVSMFRFLTNSLSVPVSSRKQLSIFVAHSTHRKLVVSKA